MSSDGPLGLVYFLVLVFAILSMVIGGVLDRD